MNEETKDRFWHTLSHTGRWAHEAQKKLAVLVNLGLLEERDGSYRITPLGELYNNATNKDQPEVTSPALRVEQEPRS